MTLYLLEHKMGVEDFDLRRFSFIMPVRPKKFQFLEKRQNRNFDQKFEIYSLDLG